MKVRTEESPTLGRGGEARPPGEGNNGAESGQMNRYVQMKEVDKECGKKGECQGGKRACTKTRMSGETGTPGK